MTLQRYADWRPTGFDSAGLGLDDRQDWLVCPVSRNRDSEGGTDHASILTESNFAVVLSDLRTYDTFEEDPAIEVHRLGHWACGWLEVMLVKPGTRVAVEAEQWAAFLSEVYPVASDEDLSEREEQAATDVWYGASLRDRIEYVKRVGLSCLAARHPLDVLYQLYPDHWSALRDRLLSC